MKINEVEKFLNITKANIRFYEKEGLITPSRSENGYREYCDADILQLKEIIILRKLGIPVQQIADILDGALPLQDALNSNILALQSEVKKLNGSLALCKQLKQENSHFLDTERYWNIINDKEKQGYQFQNLAEDYLKFVEERFQNRIFIPESKKRNRKAVIVYTLLYCVLWGVLCAALGLGFFRMFGHMLYLKILFPFLLGIALLPAIIVGKKIPNVEIYYAI